MRISDWSSDVCSSDLCPLRLAFRPGGILILIVLIGRFLPRHFLRGRNDFLMLAKIGLAADAGIGCVGGSVSLIAFPCALRLRVTSLRLPAPVISRGKIELGRASCRERVCTYV